MYVGLSILYQLYFRFYVIFIFIISLFVLLSYFIALYLYIYSVYLKIYAHTESIYNFQEASGKCSTQHIQHNLFEDKQCISMHVVLRCCPKQRNDNKIEKYNIYQRKRGEKKEWADRELHCPSNVRSSSIPSQRVGCVDITPGAYFCEKQSCAGVFVLFFSSHKKRWNNCASFFCFFFWNFSGQRYHVVDSKMMTWRTLLDVSAWALHGKHMTLLM